MIQIDNKNEVVMYVRGKKNEPLGYIYFKHAPDEITDVIIIGWSKQNKAHDKFDKELGKTIAIKRGHKCTNWATNTASYSAPLSSIESLGYENLPFTIKDNIIEYFDKAKKHFRISGDVLFILPVIDKNFVIGGNQLFTEGKIETKTRYVKVMY